MTRNEPDGKLPLELLDPGRGDDMYWPRFRSRVLSRAGPELLRRRREAQLTVSELVVGWGRLVVPGTLVAAAAAFLLFFSGPGEPEPTFLDVEELLVWDDQEVFPADLLAEEETDLEFFLVAVEGRF